MVDQVFLQILNMSFTAGFVILAVMAARLLLKKAPRVISYALWAVVLFRLLCPVSFESAFSLLPVQANPIPQEMIYQQTPQIDTGINLINNAVNSSLPAATPDASMNPLQGWLAIGEVLWLAGIAALVIYSVASLLILTRRLRGAVCEGGNIYRVEGLASPFVMGVFRPKIYLPAHLTVEEKRYILLHEQTHIKRLDHLVKLVSFAVLCLHWFNPLVWAAFFLCGKDMELSCDEAVIKKLGSEIKKEYSSSLLTLATGRRIIGGSPLAFGEGDTKSRIKNVLHYKKPAFWVVAVSIIAAVAVGIGLAANPHKEPSRLDWAADIYSYRTEYMGNASKVSQISDRLTMPETFERDGIQLQSAKPPYGLIIRYQYKPVTGPFDAFMEDQRMFDANAILAFSLIQNLDVIQFSISSEETREISRTREWAEKVTGTDLWQETSTLEGFQKLSDQVFSQFADSTRNKKYLYFNFGVNASILELDYTNKTMLVAGTGTNSILNDRCLVTCGDASVIRVVDEKPVALTFEDLKVGNSITLDIGEVQESYPTQAKATRIQVEYPPLTIDRLKTIAQKGNAVSWEDFAPYEGREVGSGLYIMRYPMAEPYYVAVGGVPDQSPMYVHLGSADTDTVIDIRAESIDDFIAANDNAAAFLSAISQSFQIKDGTARFIVPDQLPEGYTASQLSVHVSGRMPMGDDGSGMSLHAFETEEEAHRWQLGKEYTERMFDADAPHGTMVEATFSLLEPDKNAPEHSITVTKSFPLRMNNG